MFNNIHLPPGWMLVHWIEGEFTKIALAAPFYDKEHKLTRYAVEFEIETKDPLFNKKVAAAIADSRISFGKKAPTDLISDVTEEMRKQKESAIIEKQAD